LLPKKQALKKTKENKIKRTTKIAGMGKRDSLLCSTHWWQRACLGTRVFEQTLISSWEKIFSKWAGSDYGPPHWVISSL